MTEHNCKQEKTIKDLVEFKGSTESSLKTIFNLIEDIKNNDLKHLNMKLNALLFTVIATIFAGIIKILLEAVR